MATIEIEKDLLVPMRDGVRLGTTVIRQADAGPRPVLLARTPYNKDAWLLDNLFIFDVFRAVEAGYTVVVQDSRGRFASEGDFTSLLTERDDGQDALAWAATQPWSNGVLGMFGGSYVGATQWLAAQAGSEALKALVPVVTISDSYEGMQYQGGVKVHHGVGWAMVMGGEALRRRLAAGGTPPADPAAFDIDAATNRLPLVDQPLLAELSPYYLDWLTHPQPGAYWEPGSPNAAYERITAPALNVGGWFDIFLWGTLENYTGMRRRGGSEVARQNQRLIIGPWSHMNYTGSFPEREFGMGAGVRAIDLTGLHLRWYDRWLKGEPNGVEPEPPVKLFVMGIDQWRNEADWPLPDTQYRSYYLHSGGGANSLRGDGALSVEPPGDEPADTFLYDPHRPVPTLGGQVLIPGGNGTGPRDQREVEARDDVLVYSTPVLDAPVEVTGPVELELFIASSTPDTDFTGKLIDVHPDGRAMLLTEGILRARYRTSFTGPELMEPGEIYALRLDLWATSNVFLPGHRIRLEVSSSNFPRFTRNSNTGGDVATEPAKAYRPAIQQVFHDPAHRSRLILPIIER